LPETRNKPQSAQRPQRGGEERDTEKGEGDRAERKVFEMAEAGDREALNRLTERIIGAAIDVHRALGPGLLESAYEACLAFELIEEGLQVEQQKSLPLVYKQVRLDCGYRLDLVVESLVIIEIKAVEALTPLHEAQVLSYLKLSHCPVGLLINFNVKLLRSGIRRIIHDT
jgi:GxxExxY protein